MPKVKDKGAKGRGRGRARKRVDVDPLHVYQEANHDMLEPDPPQRGANWTPAEKLNLYMALNARKHEIKGAYTYHSEGNDSKEKSWQEVAAYVNLVSAVGRDVAGCKRKLKDSIPLVKKKHRVLQDALRKTGREPVTPDMRLTVDEESLLDYIGDTAINGIPGIEATALYHSRRWRREKEPKPWKEDRPGKWDYSKVLLQKERVERDIDLM